ncbi:MAG: SCP2 sterol-binding domain-containing protein [Proteobacteria bacterium]|nr:SCP2 sterol-binding domain-containing protein [Pseudomonadota bacterium]
MTFGYAHAGWRGPRSLAPPAPPLFLLQPLLARIARAVARRHPEMFARLGIHQTSRFVIEPIGLPFVLYLQPAPRNPILRALPRHARPVCEARIAAPFLQLLRMIDGEADGDAVFFARDLVVSGDTEAVVSLRNAIDDLDGSLAASVAGVFGPPGKLALALLSRRAKRQTA